jgi:hypothetical protein
MLLLLLLLLHSHLMFRTQHQIHLNDSSPGQYTIATVNCEGEVGGYMAVGYQGSG